MQAHAALSRLARERAELDAEEARWLLRALRSAAHVHLGFASFAEYAERLFGYRPRTTQEKLRVAEALEGLPRLARALEAGDLGWCAARELTRVAVPDTESAWLDVARGKTLRELETLVANRSPGDAPNAPPTDRPRFRVLRFEVTPETFATFREATLKVRRDAGASLDDDTLLLAMARQVLGGPDDEGRASYQISLQVCTACGAAAQSAAGELVPLDPAIVDMAQCDAQHLGDLLPSAVQPPTRAANENANRDPMPTANERTPEGPPEPRASESNINMHCVATASANQAHVRVDIRRSAESHAESNRDESRATLECPDHAHADAESRRPSEAERPREATPGISDHVRTAESNRDESRATLECPDHAHAGAESRRPGEAERPREATPGISDHVHPSEPNRDESGAARTCPDHAHVGAESKQPSDASALNAIPLNNIPLDATPRNPAATPARPSRAKQTIPPALRRAVLARDRHRCTVPGCTHATFVDVHHVQPRSEGGRHEPSNLLTLCSAHHRAVHRGDLHIDRDPDARVCFRHPDGSPYGSPLTPQLIDAHAKVFSALRHLGFPESAAKAVLRELRADPAFAAASVEGLLREALCRIRPTAR